MGAQIKKNRKNKKSKKGVTIKTLPVSLLQAWHAWAYMNYEAVLFYKQKHSNQDVPQNPGDIASTSSTTTVAGGGGEDSKDVDAVQKDKSDLVFSLRLILPFIGDRLCSHAVKSFHI